MNNSHQASHVTLVITHSVQAEKQQAYEQWLEQIMPQAAQFPGHLGVNVLRPVHGESVYTVLIRFDSLDNLFNWTQSEAPRSGLRPPARRRRVRRSGNSIC